MSLDIAPAPQVKSQFAERYNVEMDKPLEEFDTPGGNAYLATDKSKSDIAIYALVHFPSVPVRDDLYQALKNRPIANLICPLDRGLVTLKMKEGKQQRLVTILSVRLAVH